MLRALLKVLGAGDTLIFLTTFVRSGHLHVLSQCVSLHSYILANASFFCDQQSCAYGLGIVAVPFAAAMPPCTANKP